MAASRSLRASFIGTFGPPEDFLPCAAGGSDGAAAEEAGGWPAGREGM